MRKSEFEEFAADPLGSPERILACDLLNQIYQVLSETRPTSAGVTLEAPEEFEPRTMQAEERLRLEHEERLCPGWEAAGEEQEGEVVAAGKARLVDLALKEDKLLPEEDVLKQELGLSASDRERCRAQRRSAAIGSSRGKAIRARQEGG